MTQAKRLPAAAAQIEESESEQLELEDQVIRPPKCMWYLISNIGIHPMFI